MPRCRTKDVMGVKVTSPDAVLWHWMIGDRTYNWCPAGQLRVHVGAGTQRLVMFSRTIEGAVGYTMGYSDGYENGRDAERGEGLDLAEGPG